MAIFFENNDHIIHYCISQSFLPGIPLALHTAISRKVMLMHAQAEMNCGLSKPKEELHQNV